MKLRRTEISRRQIKSSEGEFIWELEKWYELKPELFIQNPLDFKTKLLTLNQHYYTRFCIQPCET